MNFYKVCYKFFTSPGHHGRFKICPGFRRTGKCGFVTSKGNTMKEAIDRIKQDYFDTQLNNWSVWTPAQEQILSYSLAPHSRRLHPSSATCSDARKDSLATPGIKPKKACEFLFDSIIISSDLDEGCFILLVNLSFLESSSRTRTQ